MKAANSSIRPQFSLMVLLGIMTLVCLSLVIPAGYIVLIVGTVWLLVVAAMVRVLLIFRAPIYRLLSGTRIEESRQEPL